jgi:hypothetical protein
VKQHLIPKSLEPNWAYWSNNHSCHVRLQWWRLVVGQTVHHSTNHASRASLLRLSWAGRRVRPDLYGLRPLWPPPHASPAIPYMYNTPYVTCVYCIEDGESFPYSCLHNASNCLLLKRTDTTQSSGSDTLTKSVAVTDTGRTDDGGKLHNRWPSLFLSPLYLSVCLLLLQRDQLHIRGRVQWTVGRERGDRSCF